MEDARLAWVVEDTQNTAATGKGDTQMGVAGVVQDSRDNTHGGSLVLLAMDHCHVDLWCTPDNHTVRLIAATVDEKLVDEMVGDPLEGRCVLGVRGADSSIRGSILVHRKEDNVPVPWKGEDARLSSIQTRGWLEGSSSLC